LKAEGSSARTFVACAGSAVVGYCCLAAGAIAHESAPSKVRRNMPDPIPVILIGRLAVDSGWQGRGLGKALLKDAIVRSFHAGKTIGVRAILVHAIDREAAAFYERWDFLPSPIDARVLMLAIETARAALA
jgi:GNAT superfamily N-acetyltransferase